MALRNKNDNYLVIMAGGVGSRFWPYSRHDQPKQFLDVLGAGYSLLQMTYERFSSFCPKENVYVVTNEHYESLVKEQLPELTDDQILLEPSRKNTAPCIAYACYKIASKNPNSNIIVTPSDHAIFKENKFSEAIEEALDAISDETKLLTIGINPTRPDTGYGYIKYEEKGVEKHRKVLRFTEKPVLEQAENFLKEGNFLWNSGIFVWKSKAILDAFSNYLPLMAKAFTDLKASFYTSKEKGEIRSAYEHLEEISIDYGIMEKSKQVHVVLGDFGWSDLGSWNSLHSIKDKEIDNNVVEANAMLYNTEDCMILSHNPEKLIIAEGLKGYLIADFEDVILICNKDNEKRFREFVKDVKQNKGEHYL